MIMGITGRIASGKGIVRAYFEEKGFKYASVSPVVRAEAEKRGIPLERSKLQDLGNEVRAEEGGGVWMRRLIEEMDLDENQIIDGIRNPGEVVELRKLYLKKLAFYLFSVDAPQLIRYQRMLGRERPSDPKTWEEFLKVDERDYRELDASGQPNPFGQQVGLCMQMADYKFTNDCTVEWMRLGLNHVYREILRRRHKVMG